MLLAIAIILLLMFIGVLPVWHYNEHWGYGGPSILGAALLICLVVYVAKRI